MLGIVRQPYKVRTVSFPNSQLKKLRHRKAYGVYSRYHSLDSTAGFEPDILAPSLQSELQGGDIVHKEEGGSYGTKKGKRRRGEVAGNLTAEKVRREETVNKSKRGRETDHMVRGHNPWIWQLKGGSH